MALSDPIGDMLTRIRNASMVGMKTVVCPDSSVKRSILDVLQREGYVHGYTRKEVRTGISELLIDLKYFDKKSVIRELIRVSKPSRRIYTTVLKMPRSHNGLGSYIISTPKGLMSDTEARHAKLGGEVICKVF